MLRNNDQGYGGNKMKINMMATIGMMLVLLVTLGASAVWAQQTTEQENDGETQISASDLEKDMVDLGEKVYNSAFREFTLNYTDTVIDVLSQILAKKGVDNKDPASLQRFIDYNQINKDAFFRDVETVRNHIASAQVDLYNGWFALLDNKIPEAQALYDKAKASYDVFLPAAKKVNDEIDRWQKVPAPSRSDLKDDILKLGEKAYNHALVIFTTNYTDTVIDVIRKDLIKNNVSSDPQSLENFIKCNSINKDAFFRDVDKARDFLAETQVDIFYAWTAYLDNNMIEAQAQYDRALAAYNQFIPVAAAVNAERDRWRPCPSPSGAPSGNGQSTVKKQDTKVQKTIVKNRDKEEMKDQKTVQKAIDKTEKEDSKIAQQQKPAKITGAVVKNTSTETKEPAPIGFIARIVAFLKSLF
ncbi:hypothetical protein HYS50_02790 [Candidatus Woesearchaeota archaeon]|nr:hypothetical protein [Candidatus Woesearchaeota archaeon]